MIAILLLALVVHPGGAPSDWQPVSGVANLQYRWSLPYSNSCRVEFEAKDSVAAQQYQLVTRIVVSRPAPAIEPNPDSPMRIEPTKVKPQTSDRSLQIDLRGMGRTSKTLHDCYGVQTMEAHIGETNDTTTSEPLSDTNPK